MDLDVTLLKLYNADMKLGITLKRTRDKKYKYVKQITPNRNIHSTSIHDDLDTIKGDLFCDVINGYTITHNMLGLDFVDEIINYTPVAPGCTETSNATSSSDPGLCVSELHHPQLEEV